jgi:exopolysaccharide production protein ExoY
MMDAVDDGPASRQKRHTKSQLLNEAKRQLLSALRAQLARMRAGIRDDEQRDQPLGGRIKRTFDVALASVVLALVAPILLMAIGLIGVFMSGSVLSAEPRIGFNGKSFSCYRFRTTGRQTQEARKLDNPLTECVACVLSKSGITGLPQLLNVLRGDMSFVGPRPIGPDELRHYGSGDQWYLKARPGLTGIWRASGRNGYRAPAVCDRYYTTRWSLGLDLILLIRTAAELQDFNDPA